MRWGGTEQAATISCDGLGGQGKLLAEKILFGNVLELVRPILWALAHGAEVSESLRGWPHHLRDLCLAKTRSLPQELRAAERERMSFIFHVPALG